MFCKKCFAPIEEGKDYCAKCSIKEQKNIILTPINNQRFQQKCYKCKEVKEESILYGGKHLCIDCAQEMANKKYRNLWKLKWGGIGLLIFWCGPCILIPSPPRHSTGILGPFVSFLLFFLVVLKNYIPKTIIEKKINEQKKGTNRNDDN